MQMEKLGNKRFVNLRILLVVAITGLVMLAVLSVSALHGWMFVSYAQGEAQKALQASAKSVESKAERLLEPAVSLARHILNHKAKTVTARSGFGKQSQFESFLGSIAIIPSLQSQINSAYLGFPDGSFVGLMRTTPELRKIAGLPPGNRSSFLRLERDAADAKKTDYWSYREGHDWHKVKRKQFDYDPRVRPWYKLGLQARQPRWTGLYRFSVEDGMGITLAGAVRSSTGKVAAVLGVDLRMDDLARFVQNLRVGNTGYAFIARSNGELIAHPILVSDGVPREAEVFPPTLVSTKMLGGGDVAVFQEFAKSSKDLVQVEVGNEKLMAYRLPLDDRFGLDANLYVTAPLSDFTGAAAKVAWLTLWITAVLTVCVLLVGVLIARAIALPIRNAANAMKATENLDVSGIHSAETSYLAEIDSLNKSVATMQRALGGFVRYVPRELVRDMIDLRLPIELGGSRREITVLFTDVVGFTQLAESDQEERLVETLAEYFEIISSTITEHGGIVDKFIGDSVMAFWGAPGSNSNQSVQACNAVAAIAARLDEFNQKRVAATEQPLLTRFALHRGQAFVGNVGARERFAYTALGDVVNTASRLETAGKERALQAIVSAEVMRSAGHGHRFEPIGSIKLRGKQRSVEAFELKCCSEQRPAGCLNAASELLEM